MTTIYTDIDKNGRKIYYSHNRAAGRYIRMGSAEAEMALATEQAHEEAYLPLKPYSEYTLRQLLIAQERYKDREYNHVIDREIKNRLNAAL